jgi:hypothetical protein
LEAPRWELTVAKAQPSWTTSHANMAVAGKDCTIIATSTSGHHATVTPFSSNLPKMKMV